MQFQTFPDSCGQGIYGRVTAEQLLPKGFAFLFLINPDFFTALISRLVQSECLPAYKIEKYDTWKFIHNQSWVA